MFTTRELALAATLVTLGHENVGLDIQYEGRRNLLVGYLSFQKTPELDKDVQKYWARELRVEPQAFHAATRSLKSRVTDAVSK